MNDPDDPTLKPSDVARRLNVTPRQVRQWIAEKALEAVNVSGDDRPTYRVSPASLRSFITSRRTVSPPASRRRRTVADDGKVIEFV
jgi:DNA-binding transcriptional regulator YdaS (Cro superfamily)